MVPDWVKKLPVEDQVRVMLAHQELIGRMMLERERSPALLDSKAALSLAIARAALEEGRT